MANRYPRLKPREYELIDEGRLVLRRLGTARYVGLILPEFIKVHGRTRGSAVQMYEALELARSHRAVGMMESPHMRHRSRERYKRAEWQLAFEWLRRPWA